MMKARKKSSVALAAHRLAKRRRSSNGYAPRALLNGREVSDAELAEIREMIETFGIVDLTLPGMRELLEERWPELSEKIERP